MYSPGQTSCRHKLNVSVSSLKLNLSDRRLSLLVEFARHFPLPHLLISEDTVDGFGREHWEELVCDAFRVRLSATRDLGHY